MDIKVNFSNVTTKALEEADSKRSIYFEDIFKTAINYKNEERSAVELPTSYLIVAPENLESNPDLQKFIEWKQQKGFNVVTNYIFASATVESVDSWVEDQYSNLTPTPSFLLIVGDMNGDYVVPTKTSNIGGASVSDLSYGVIGNPSTSNHVKSIYVGRFSVRGLSDLTNQVNKTIWYEKDGESVKTKEPEEGQGLNFPKGVSISEIWTQSQGTFSLDFDTIWVSRQGYMDQLILHLSDDEDNVISLHFSPFLESVSVYDEYTPDS
jgi:hypothetical protein